MSDSPNPVMAALSMLRAMRVSRPAPHGAIDVDHQALGDVLDRLCAGGINAIGAHLSRLADYRAAMEQIDPDSLARPAALAYWLNLYNAGAIDLAAETAETAGTDRSSVLRMPGAFTRPWATVAGETLSLNDIEHGKIRRFGDPRIHSALVCGSASCPTLRYEPYAGAGLDKQLDSQMRSFLANGGAVGDGSRLHLSRIFLWYGADFVHPGRMPSWLPVGKRALRGSLRPWLDPALAELPISFQSYDWSLSCSIG